MIDRVYFIFPEDPTLDFDVPLPMFEQFCDFVHKKNPNIESMKRMEYVFKVKRLCCERWIQNKTFLEYWSEFRTKYGHVDELIDG